MRVEIEGQEPFTATRGSLVNIPRQTIYSVETIGTAPSLRFTLNVAGAKTVYPQDVEPPPAAPASSGCRCASTARQAATTSSTSRT